MLTRKALSQGLIVVKLNSLLWKFFGRHNDLVNRCVISVSQMTTYVFHLSYSQNRSPYLIDVLLPYLQQE